MTQGIVVIVKREELVRGYWQLATHPALPNRPTFIGGKTQMIWEILPDRLRLLLEVCS